MNTATRRTITRTAEAAVLRAACFLAGLLAATVTLAQSTAAVVPPPLPTYDELDTVLVIGERSGPALWSVRHGDHTLWILPMFGPLPDRLVWRSSEVEAVIRQSQQVIADTGVAMQRSSDRRADERLRKAVTNVGGKRLQTVMPRDLYAQFTVLNRTYAGDSTYFEQFRPFQATDLLRERAMLRLTLTSDGGIPATVQRLAAQHGVKFTAPPSFESREWDKVIAELDRTPREADVACAKARLDRLETDLRESIARANAWARGDIQALRDDAGLRGGADIAVCEQFFRHMRFVRQRMQQLRAQSLAMYVRALKENRSTLALVAINDMFDANGLVAKFVAAGYEVVEPPQMSDR